MRRPSLALQFLVANLLVLLAGMLMVGAWVGQKIETAVLDHAGTTAAAYVDVVISSHLQALNQAAALNQDQVHDLDQLLGDALAAQDVVAFKVWSTDGTVLYSPNRDLIGRQFPIDEGLARSLSGEVSSDISDLGEPENVAERLQYQRLLQVYTPVRDQASGRVIGAAEFYQPPDQLDADLATARVQSWLVVAGVALASYLLLAGIVKRGSDTIIRQEDVMQRQYDELAALHERVRHAAARTTTLNEQALRRISADLHDGPGQMLALAMLRLGTLRDHSDDSADVREFEAVNEAVRDALAEIRTISADLRLPDLEPLTLAQVAERAVNDHQRRTEAHVELDCGVLPDEAPLAVKTALLRTLQEALSNATRHAGAGCVRVELRSKTERLQLRVTDSGPGLDVERAYASGRLGLVGMRERAEVLGGTLRITSVRGEGTEIVVEWPLNEVATIA